MLPSTGMAPSRVGSWQWWLQRGTGTLQGCSPSRCRDGHQVGSQEAACCGSRIVGCSDPPQRMMGDAGELCHLEQGQGRRGLSWHWVSQCCHPCGGCVEEAGGGHPGGSCARTWELCPTEPGPGLAPRVGGAGASPDRGLVPVPGVPAVTTAVPALGTRPWFRCWSKQSCRRGHSAVRSHCGPRGSVGGGLGPEAPLLAPAPSSCGCGSAWPSCRSPVPFGPRDARGCGAQVAPGAPGVAAIPRLPSGSC